MIRSKLFALLPAIVCGVLLPVGSDVRAEDFKVTPVAVNETRYNILIPSKRKSYYNNSLMITLRFEGEGVAKATRYGKLKLISAKDDTGADIKLSRNFSISGKRLQNVARNRYNVLGQKSKDNEFEIPLRLELPARSAKALSELKGSVVFGIGKVEKVIIPISKLENLSGKNIEDPLLEKMGLTVNLEKYAKTSGHRARLKISGEKRDTVLNATFVDPAGKAISFGSYVFRSFNHTTASASTSKLLPEASTLQLLIETERKDTEVTFDFKDIPLK